MQVLEATVQSFFVSWQVPPGSHFMSGQLKPPTIEEANLSGRSSADALRVRMTPSVSVATVAIVFRFLMVVLVSG
jgi:hypothetical protein